MKHLFYLLLLVSTTAFSAEAPLGKILSRRYSSLSDTAKTLILITFTDKGDQNRYQSLDAKNFISEKSIRRRSLVRSSANVVDEQDYPVEQSYVDGVTLHVQSIRHVLKWFNAVSALATKRQIEELRSLPFVREIELVGRWKKKLNNDAPNTLKSDRVHSSPKSITSLDYGPSFTQLNQINVPAVHDLGIYGQGIIICMFDEGIRMLAHQAFDSMNIIAMHDFVDHKESVVPNNPGFGYHGTATLSVIGGYSPGTLIGPAFKASYILARTENDSSETPIEEDNWAAGIQWAESIGVDVTSTSLVYLTFDPGYTSLTWQDMNGHTAIITNAADRAVGLGVTVVNAAGNAGAGDSTQNTLWAPADGDSVITAGAVDASGARAGFSSIGPTTDIPPRIKPDVMAMGVGVILADGSDTTTFSGGSGTSFACPLSAGVAALLRCANPTLTPMQVREAMRQTASRAGSPDNFMGWGILNALNAINYYGILSLGKIRGMVFNDYNGNGIRDNNEPGIPSVVIHCSGTKNDSTITDSNGFYVLDSLPIGSFTITHTVPLHYVQSSPQSGSHTISILFRADTSGFNFGDIHPPSSTYIVNHGWNLLSLPQDPADHHVTSLYPTATSDAFSYSGSYQPVDSLPNGTGYWLRFENDQNIAIGGSIRFSETINLSSGWNLIGSLSYPVSFGAIYDSAGIISSPLFGYNTSYFTTDTLQPHSGYWVKASGSGMISLSATSPPLINNHKMYDLSKHLNQLTFTDATGKQQTIYFTTRTELKASQQFYELPPVPPDGGFDVRFTNGTMLGISDKTDKATILSINVSAANYPLTIRWKIVENNLSASLIADGQSLDLTADGAKQIPREIRSLTLALVTNELPKAYALEQNYPNPFNPSTVIRYQLPVGSNVRLLIYDLLGRVVSALVDERQDAGYHSVVFNAANLPSGIYYYKLQAGKFTGIKKLLLIR
jgi:serine protease AprX